jgi:hypothetical protein
MQMATNPTKAPRKTPQRLTLLQQLAHEHSMAVMSSTATIDILDEDGVLTERLVHLGKEYVRKFFAAHGIEGGEA